MRLLSLFIFAFASLTETFGNVVLEAMASGMPVVAVRAGGVGDTVQECRTGRLVEPDEPPEADAAFESELARRVAEIRAGKAKGKPAEQVFADLRGR